ncbi:uncharacterized protein MKK02DRAFT_33436 [Dioszegia hungarica]|uniref:Uncharacterized protein n=1 Tax=Dioszegia hungarica TaxID=4972 RepID=A0AA38H8E9_9TREE|nr:uncharacterized protein MKK02DRAFT_33436 [Dioszegia hungarica]KAI9636188.1 hypothetical protein MKK02DRAFT_33436 [Dioszegia hungarica]
MSNQSSSNPDHAGVPFPDWYNDAIHAEIAEFLASFDELEQPRPASPQPDTPGLTYAQYARMLSDVHGSRFNSPVPIPWDNGTVSPSQIFAPPPSEVSTFSGISGLTTSSGTTLGSGSSRTVVGANEVAGAKASLASYVPSNAGSSTSSDSTVVPVVIHPVATRGTLSSPHSVKSSESGVTRNTKVRHLRVAKIKATGTIMVPPCVRCLANGTPCYWSPDFAGCAECTAHARLCSFGSHKRRRTGYSPIWNPPSSSVGSTFATESVVSSGAHCTGHGLRLSIQAFRGQVTAQHHAQMLFCDRMDALAVELIQNKV